MSARDGDAGEPVFERNLRALLQRCHAPALPDPAFRERARAACLAAAREAHEAGGAHDVGGARDASGGRDEVEERDVRELRRPRRLVAWRPVLAAAALLVCAVSAVLWFAADAAGDDRRDAILAGGEVAARTGPHARWQAFGPDEEDGPDARDVAHAELADGSLEAFTPAGLGFDVRLPAGGPTAGAFLDPESSAELRAAAGLDVTLASGGLSLSRTLPGAAWTLATPHGTLQLDSGALTARLLGEAGGDGVWLLADGRAALIGASAPTALPAGRALRLWHGALTVLSGEPGADGRPTADGLRLPAAPREPEPLHPRDAAVQPPVIAATAAPAPAPRLLQGRVRRDGKPVTAYRLVLVPQEIPPRANPSARDVSAPDGRFLWPDVAPGSYLLFVQAPGSPAWRSGVLAVTESEVLAPIDAELPLAGASIAGFVVDAATGDPVAGAVVLSEVDAATRLLSVDAAELPPTVLALTRSDDLGAFRLDGLSPGEQLLRATAPGYAPAWSGALPVTAGEPADGLLLKLERESVVGGRVVGLDGRPWAGAIMISSPQPGTVRPCVTYGSTLTDADGTYRIGNQPAGAGIMIMFGDDAARSSGFMPRIQPASLSPDAVAVVDFLLAPEQPAPVVAAPAAGAGCLLHGRLLDSSGAPVAGRMVSIDRHDAPDEQAGEHWRGALSTADGGYAFADLGPGTWDVFVGAGDGTSISFVALVDVPAAPELERDVHLPDGALAGRITRAADGSAVTRGLVILMRRNAAGAWEFQGRLFAESTGSFHVEHLPPGRYALTVHDMEGLLAQQSSEELQLAAGDTLEDLAFALAPGAAIAVRVRDARGQPVAGARVRFTDERGEERQFAEDSHTDGTGLHDARGMPPGLWFVAVSPPAGKALGTREQSLQLRAGDAQELVVVLPDAP